MPLLNLSDASNSRHNIPSTLCVVGAGIAGLLLARRIAQKGYRVTVVESGTSAFDAAIHGLNEIEDPAGLYSRALTGRYRGLGGTSSHWGGRMIPISSHEADNRHHISQPGWPFPIERLDEYEKEIERLFDVDDDSYERPSFPRSSQKSDFPCDNDTFTPRWAKCPGFKKCNIANILKNELNRLGNIDIWLDATVCDFELDRISGRLKAITARNFSGKSIEIRADQFVLAAGAIETTRLLLLLDEASDGRAFDRCKVLGHYFQDHLKAEVAIIDRSDATVTNRLFSYRYLRSTRRDLHLELSKSAQQTDAVGSAFAYVSMDLAGSPLGGMKKFAQGLQQGRFDTGELRRVSKNIGLLTQSAYWRIACKQLFVPAGIDFRMMVCVEQLPHWDNRIRLGQTRDRLGVRKAKFEWGPTETEERTFRSAIRHLDTYWRRAGLDTICPLLWTTASRNPDMPIIEHAEACAHPSGSTRMGTDPAQSVVGPDLLCHAVPNVAVISASVFPTAGSANPTFTIMKLALSLADFFIRTMPM